MRILKPGILNEHFSIAQVEVPINNLITGTEYNPREDIDEDTISTYVNKLSVYVENGMVNPNERWQRVFVTDDIDVDNIDDSFPVVLSGNHSVRAMLRVEAFRNMKLQVSVVVGVSKTDVELCRFVASQMNSKHGRRLEGQASINAVKYFLSKVDYKPEADTNLMSPSQLKEYESDTRPTLKEIGLTYRKISALLGVSNRAVYEARKQIKEELGYKNKSHKKPHKRVNDEGVVIGDGDGVDMQSVYDDIDKCDNLSESKHHTESWNNILKVLVDSKSGSDYEQECWDTLIEFANHCRQRSRFRSFTIEFL